MLDTQGSSKQDTNKKRKYRLSDGTDNSKCFKHIMDADIP